MRATERTGAAMQGAAMDARTGAAERLLRERGLEGARVSAAGHQREIAAVEAPVHLATRLMDLAPEIKALGFRYVALDLSRTEEPE